MSRENWLLLLGFFIIAGALMAKKVLGPPIEAMAKAIATFEGFFISGSVAARNNNPGNLKAAGQPGVTGQDPQGHAIFGTLDQGWQALHNQLRIAFGGSSRVYNPFMSLYEFFQKYAEGSQRQYAEYVARQLGVSPMTTLREIEEKGTEG